MRHLRSISIPRMIMFIVFLMVCTMSSPAQVINGSAKEDLLKLEQALNLGVKTHDTTMLKDILANEFQLTGVNSNKPVPRDAWLVNCFQWSFDSATHTEIYVTSWEDVAVFRSLQYFYNLKVGKNKTVTKSPGSWVTDLWIRRGGKWQLLTRLSERIKQ